MINKPTKEQQKIINNIKRKNNVIVNAVAGSGKTTTILSLAKQLSNKKILLLTYNKKLKIETKEKIEKNNIKNIDIFTFHGFATNISKCTIKDDLKLEMLIKTFDFKSMKSNWDIICLDEMQDCNINLFNLIKKCFYNKRNDFVWLILGDIRQCIYQYNGSDYRFLTFFDKLFKIKCKKLSITTNYRCAKSICNFWNKHCRKKEDKKLAPFSKFNSKVKYISLNNSYDCYKIIELIRNLKNKYNYKDDDFLYYHSQ